MRTLATAILILALLLTVSGAALAGDAADLARPHVRRLVTGIEQATGWDCQYRLVETADLFAGLVWCEK